MGNIIGKGSGKILTNRWGLLLYYLGLLLVFLSWRNFDAVPGAGIRIGYMLAVMAPCYLIDKKWLPAVMTLFLTLSTHGLSTAYLPAKLSTFIVVMIAGLFISGGAGRHDRRFQLLLVILFFYSTILNLVTSAEVNYISECLIVVILLTYYIDYRDEYSFKLFSLSIILAALSLSTSLLMNLDQVMTTAGITNIEGAERAGFRDINYSACAVSCGVIVALIEITNRKSGVLVFVVSTITIGVSLVALALNASRASILAIAIAGIVIIWFSRLKIAYKVLLTLFAVGGIYYMFTSEMFDVLVARMQGDDGTGTGRTLVWQTKIEDFANCGFFAWIFGLGHTIGREFDVSRIGFLGFHNDFLAFWVCYGLIGISILITVFFYPLRKMSKENANRPLVIASLMGLLMVCMTLEPFAAGRVPFYMFLVYIVWLSRIGELNNSYIVKKKKQK